MRTVTIENFLTQLAAKQPTPGGGSASALGGAIGAALASMSAVYTSGEKYAAVEGRVRELLEKFGALRGKFLDLVDADISAYGAYAAARSLPKGTPEEKRVRAAAMAAANEQSTVIPERIVETALEALTLLEDLAGVVNPNLAGDVAVSAYFLEAAARGAAIQVMSNCAAVDTEGKNVVRRMAVCDKVSSVQAARERIDQAVRTLLKL
ncbi:MAG TPA: cyclodeaminase/cyclohydrolase family protein [Planctomycetota bacterium]|nr:cyclodeaminase/cyclohydrolase family protein [Planctomycetota bacterium]